MNIFHRVMKNADNDFLISSFVPTPDDLDKKPKSLHVLTEHSGSEWAGGKFGRRTCSFVILHPTTPQKKWKEKSVYSLSQQPDYPGSSNMVTGKKCD